MKHKKVGKRFASILLTIGMLFGVLSATAFAAGEQSMPFTDVKETDWFYDSVQYVYENEMMNGTGDTVFSPNADKMCIRDRKFTYIRAGKEDHRLRLAKNGQVEMVSGYALDSKELRESKLVAGRAVFSIPGEGGKTEVCFAFTRCV